LNLTDKEAIEIGEPAMSRLSSSISTRSTGAAVALSLLSSVAFTTALWAADPTILTGTVTSPGGEKMGGVTVSAKAVGATITATVFTDEAGAYYFPALAPGKYRVRAQALGFETANGEADLKTGARADFALKKIEDTERLIRQLPGDLILAGLPEETTDDMRMKRIIHNNCTSCHGWHALRPGGQASRAPFIKPVPSLGYSPTLNVKFPSILWVSADTARHSTL
jgi:hypothetical protein